MTVSRTRILRGRSAGPHHRVVSVEGGEDKGYCRRPCADCPWRVDATGVFPAEAFRHSAETAYDMSTHAFACHTAGIDRPRWCAGFLLHGADHNLTIRLARMRGDVDDDVSDGGHAMHPSYAAMAIANGVDRDDPVLRPCRSSQVSPSEQTE